MIDFNAGAAARLSGRDDFDVIAAAEDVTAVLEEVADVYRSAGDDCPLCVNDRRAIVVTAEGNTGPRCPAARRRQCVDRYIAGRAYADWLRKQDPERLVQTDFIAGAVARRRKRLLVGEAQCSGQHDCRRCRIGGAGREQTRQHGGCDKSRFSKQAEHC